MSPTIFRQHGLRFFFFSREESRVHVHVSGENGTAEIWLDPKIEVVKSHGLGREIGLALTLVREREDEIRAAWREHFRDSGP